MFFLEVGNPQNPAIVFLHGSPLSSRMWRAQIETLKNDYYCIAPDLPGHGDSAGEQFESADHTARQVAGFILEKVPVKRAHVVGLSFGGVIAQAMLTRVPDVLHKVILSGTSGRLNPLLVKMQNLNKPLFKLLRPEQLARLVVIQFGIPLHFVDDFRQDFKKFSVESFSRMMDAYGTIEPLSEVKTPFLAVAGEKETFVAKDMARKLAQSSPHGQGGIVKAAGHVWNLQFPDLFSEMFTSFINDRPLPSAISMFKK